MLVKGYTIDGYKGQAYHIHVRYKGDWDELFFRDYLINQPDIAKEYEKLKIDLAKKHKYNRELYTEAKSDFVYKISLLKKF